MQTPYSLQVAEAFNDAPTFGNAAATSFELGALRELHRANGGERAATLRAIYENGYPLPTEITPEMVGLTGAAHACGVAIQLAEVRGVEGMKSTYESYTAKNRFDRFTRLHLPEELREEWDAPIARKIDANPKISYPKSADMNLVYGVGKPHRYLPAQTMRHLEYARLGKLDNSTKESMGIASVEDQNKFAVSWDDLIPTIETASDITSLAGELGAEIAKHLLRNGLTSEQVAGILKKSYGIEGIKEEHGNIEEADRVYTALIESLTLSEGTKEVGSLIAKGSRTV